MTSKATPMTFGDRLVLARRNAGYTQQSTRDELEERGIVKGKSAIGHWETGKALPPGEVIPHLCEMYEVSADYLFFGERQSDALDPIRLDAATFEAISTMDKVQLGKLAKTIRNRVEELIDTPAAATTQAPDSGNGAGEQKYPLQSQGM